MIWLLFVVASLVSGKDLSNDFLALDKYNGQAKLKPALKRPNGPLHPLVNTDYCIGKSDGNYPSSRCGSKFYSCSGGLTTVLYCPGSLVFDPILDRCEVPSQSPYCTRGRVQPTPPTSPVTKTPRRKPYFSCRQKVDGLYVDQRHPCRPFYFSCSNGEAMLMHCPDGLYFDPELQICDSYSSIPVCTGRPRLITKKPAPPKKPAKELPPVDFNCKDKPTGNYPDPHSKKPFCSTVYYTCSNGVATKRRCPSSLYYDPKFDVCDRFYRVFACTGKRIERTRPPKTTPQPTVPPVPFDCRRKKDGYYANPRSICSATYYACSGGVARKMKCQYGLAFDPKTDSCQQPSVLTICGGKPLPKTVATRPPLRYTTEPPAIDCSHRSNGLYANPLRRCSRIFYICSNGQAIKMKCPPALAFDHRSKSCQLASELYICTGRHTTTMRPTRPPPTPRPVPFDCSRKPDGLYPNPKRLCSPFYYTCSNGIAGKMVCPGGLFYDPHDGICDVYSNIYVCTGRRKPKTPAPSYRGRVRPSKEFDCRGLPSGLYSAPGKRCSTYFFQCSNDAAYKLECGHGLFFDPMNKRCDRFQNIYACTGRVQPVYKPKKMVQPAYRPEYYKIPVDCIQLGDGDHAEPGVLYGRTYYSCFNGRGVRRQCPKGTFFHVVLKRCESMESLKSMRKAMYTAEPRHSKPDYDFCFEKPDGIYPKSHCSSQFVTCSGGVSTRRYCPSGLFFDADRSVCDFKEHIRSCGGSRPKMAPQLPRRKPYHEQQFDCSDLPDGDYPLSTCSNSYIGCRDGKANLMRCPEHLIFSEKHGGCDYAYRTPPCNRQYKTASRDVFEEADY